MDKVDFTKLTDNYTGLVNFVKGLREKNKDDSPVFENAPPSLKNFATKFTTFVSGLKTRLSFDFLDERLISGASILAVTTIRTS